MRNMVDGWKSSRESWERRKAGTAVEGNRANESRIGRLTSVTFVKPWPKPPGDTCNELINLIYRRLTEIQSQMRGTLIVRPLATDTIVYTRGPYSLTIALQLVSPLRSSCAGTSLRFSIFRSSNLHVRKYSNIVLQRNSPVMTRKIVLAISSLVTKRIQTFGCSVYI